MNGRKQVARLIVNVLGLLLLSFLSTITLDAQITYCADCDGGSGPCAFPAVSANPALTAECNGLNIALIIDESGSIEQANAEDEVEDAVMAFINSLSCVGVNMAVVEFNATARYVKQSYALVDDAFTTGMQAYFNQNGANPFTSQTYAPSISNCFFGGNAGYCTTNWQAAMLAVDALSSTPDLILFFTDGEPTSYSTGSNPTYNGAYSYCGGLGTTERPEIVNAMKLANKLKGEGAHMFMVGVGDIVGNTTQLERMSGTDQFDPNDPAENIGNTDYATGSFEEIAATLASFANDLCPFESEVTSLSDCDIANSGVIEIVVPANLLPVNYSYSGPASGGGTANSSPIIISGLGDGEYTIEVDITFGSCTRTETIIQAISSNCNPGFTVVKEADVSTVSMSDDVINYTITVDNTGNQSLTNISIIDPLLASLSGPTGDVDNDGKLDPSETWEYTGSYTVLQADIDNNGGGDGDIDNTVTVDFDETDPQNASEEVQIVSPPSLSVDKALTSNADGDGSGDVSLGDILTFTITVTNTGSQTLTNVVVSDAKLSPSSASCATVAPNGTCVLVGTYEVTQADVDAGQIVNTATGDSDQTDPEQDTETVPVPQSPSIAVEKTQAPANQTFTTVGDVLTYEITVTNDGNVTVYNPTVSDPAADAAPAYHSGDTDNDGALDVGETWVYTAQRTVTQGDLDNGSYYNVATGNGSADTDGDAAGDTPVTDSDDETIDATQTPALAIKKDITAGATYSAVGDVVYYSYLITNSGNVTLAGPFTVEDDIIGTLLDCAAGPLAPGENVVCTASYTITQADLDNGSVTNIAYATTVYQGNTVSSGTDFETATATQSPALTIAKSITSGDTYSAVGDLVNYSYTITNSGNVTLAGPFTVEDDVIGTLADCATGPLAPGESTACTASYAVTQADLDNGSVTNYAYATTGYQDNTVTSNTDQATATADQNPGLTTVKAALESSYASVGDVINYTITVQNTGNVTIDNIVVSDPNADSAPVCDLSSLAPGQTATCSATHTVVLADLQAGQVVNVALATGQDPNGSPVSDPSNEVIVPAVIADLTLDKEASTATPNVGSAVTFTLSVTNQGPYDATGVTVADELPAGYDFVSFSGDGSYDANTGVWTIGQLANGATATLNIVALVLPDGPYDNYAQVATSDQNDPDSNPGNDSTTEDDDDSVVIIPNPIADLELDKSLLIGSAAPAVYSHITFRLTLTNQGPSMATNVEATDQLPAGYSFVSAIASQGAYDDGTGVWQVGTLLSGQTVTLDIEVMVNINGPYTNLAEVTQATEDDLDSTPGSGVDTDNDQNVEDDPDDQDDGDGVVTNPVPPALTVDCPGDVNLGSCLTQAAIDDAFSDWLAQFGASGGCNTISSNLSQYSAPSFCGGSVTVVFEAYDDCAQVASCSATFTVASAPPLSVSCPGNQTVPACSSQSSVDAAFAAWASQFGSTGGCGTVAYYIVGNLTAFSLSNVQAPSFCGGSVTVMLNANDACGQTANCTATFTVRADTEPPSGFCPAGVTGLTNPADAPTPDEAAVAANYTDDCGSVTAAFTGSDVVFITDCEDFEVRQFFTITDACGNATSCTVIHRGRISSQITGECPNLDQSGFTCIDDVPAPDPAALAPYFTGGDGNPVAVQLSNILGAEHSCEYFEITYEYLILDNCGNTQVCLVQYSGSDNEPPVGDCPDPVSVSSLDEVPAPNSAWIESLYSDGCGSGAVQVSILGVSTTGDGCEGYTVTHSYMIQDQCQNAAFCEVVYTVPGGAGLVGDCPSTVTGLHCWADVPTGPDAIWMVEQSYSSSDGGPVDVLHLGSTVINNYCTFTYRHIYQVIEPCSGERRICVLTFEGMDDIAPEGSCPQGESGLNCLSEVPEPDPAAVALNYTDNCSTPFGYLIGRQIEGGDCEGFTVTDFYRVYDDCDNFVECYVVHSGGGPATPCPDCDNQNLQLPGNGPAIEPAGLGKLELSMGVYPNPTSGALVIEFNEAMHGHATLVVHNAYGQQVVLRAIELNGRRLGLDLRKESLASGVYFISIQAKEAVVTRQIVFNRL